QGARPAAHQGCAGLDAASHPATAAAHCLVCGPSHAVSPARAAFPCRSRRRLRPFGAGTGMVALRLDGGSVKRDPSMLASDPEVSAWVAANAGAGKTYTLANRVARLLLADAEPQKILCLTFTKAAAAEMQTRLFYQLGEWSMLPDAKLRDHIVA